VKIRTLLFGAGEGARRFMLNTASEREFIGFLDNDQRKVGRRFEGLEVHAPGTLHELDFDEIVITTQWALEVQEQLLEELRIDPRRVVLPQKKQLKNITPFANPGSLELGREIITGICSLARSMNIPLVVDFGTLLGLTRDGDIIPWDDDIDFSVPLAHAAAAQRLFQTFIEENSASVDWRIEELVDKQNRVAGLLLKFSDPQGELIEFTTSLCFRLNQNGNSLHMPSLGMWYAPERHFETFELIRWNDIEIQVPWAHRDYLGFQYGDWQTPKKDIQLSDYANLRQVDFADIQEAGFRTRTIPKGSEH
jgi:hypothetical protein